MPTIRIEDDVFKGLQQLAEPFTDTPNTVIRRLLKNAGLLSSPALVGDEEPIVPPPACRGEVLTPQSVYEKFLLHVLAHQFKGKGLKHEITKAVLSKMAKSGYSTPADQKLVTTGETRAENTTAWARNVLKERGFIKKQTQRGSWELTEQGLTEGINADLPKK